MRKIVLIGAILVLGSQYTAAQPRKTDSQPQTEQTKKQPSPASVNASPSAIDEATKAESERYRKEREAKEDEFKAEQLKQNQVVTWATVIIALATVFNLGIAVVYVVLANSQLRVIKTQAVHAGDQVGKMQEQLDAINKQEGHLAAQAAAAQTQSQVMARQTTIMDKTLVYGTRAHVGVQSVFLDVDAQPLFLQIENVGKVPAKNIQVTLEICAEATEADYEKVCKHRPQPFDWPKIGTTRRLRVPFLKDYRGTKLFPGTLRLPVMIRLDNSPYFYVDQFVLITGGYASFSIQGLITYWDGFHRDKKTEFAWRYFAKNTENKWVPESFEGLSVTDALMQGKWAVGHHEEPDADYENPESPS